MVKNDSNREDLNINLSFLELFKQAAIGMILFSTRGNVLLINPKASDLFEQNKNLKSRDFSSIFYHESFTLENWCKKALEGEADTNEHIFKIKQKESEPLRAVVAFSLIHINDSELAILCQINSVSFLKEFEDRITYRSLLMNELLNCIPDFLYIKDVKGRYLFANGSTAKTLGFEDPQALEGKTDFDFYPVKLARKYFGDEQEIITSGNPMMNIIEQIFDRNNNRRWYSTSKLPLRDSRGTIIGTMGIGRDITQWTEEQKTLRKSIHIAEEADKLKSAFLANISHEIRTPLNGILGFSQFLKQIISDDDKSKKYIDYIIKNGEQLLYLLSDILDVSKIDSGHLLINKKNFVINDLMLQMKNSVIKKTKNLGKDLQIILEMPLENSESVMFNDDQRIKQILHYLLENAVKFTYKGTITFGYRLETKLIRFYVKDTGIGIPPENIGAIFDRFRQGEFSLSRKYEGAGLGLSIAKELTALLEGKMGVYSKVSEGSEFYFTLPFERKMIKDTANKHFGRNNLRDKSIAVINDDNQSWDLIEIALLQNNADNFRIVSKKELLGITTAFSASPDLLLFNIKTTWIKSTEAIKSVKMKIPGLQILIIANKNMEDEIKECLKAGATDYIYEPVNYDLLIEKLKYLICPGPY